MCKKVVNMIVIAIMLRYIFVSLWTKVIAFYSYRSRLIETVTASYSYPSRRIGNIIVFHSYGSNNMTKAIMCHTVTF